MYRGATIWARKTLESDVFFMKPDKWFKIWFYLVSRANHEDKGQFQRGEALVRYLDISEACGATKSQIDHSIRWFKKSEMLATRKATRGMFITILNYSTYQNFDNYINDTIGDLKAKQKRNKSDTINKNDKNDKNDKKTTLADQVKDYWNTKTNLPAVRLLTTKRKNKLITRFKEAIFSENWQLIIDKVSDSSFCTGNNSTGWKAVFDWLIHDEGNYMKVLEGNYDDRQTTQTNPPERQTQSFDDQTSNVGTSVTND